MRIPFSWLSEFIDISELDPFTVAEKLSLHCTETACEKFSFNSEGILWGKIVDLRPAEGGHLIKVSLGNESINIFTNFGDLKIGDVLAVAPAGAKVKGKEVLKKRFGDYISEGTLVSYKDLDIDVLEDKPIRGDKEIIEGGSVLNDLGESEYILDIDILPNRGDLLSVRGLAREIAFLFGLHFEEKRPEILQEDDCKDFDIEIVDNDCYRYRGIIIRDVKVSDSPLFIKRRLHLSGIKLINDVVDITNYVMIEEGQPLHAFDFDRLIGGVKIRSAEEGERIVALDGSVYELSKENLLIADWEKPIAIAGVIGGKDTGVYLNTKNILLESAYFDPFRIRKSSKLLGISTESSYRFERNVDIENLPFAQSKAVELILKYSGGKVISVKDLYKKPYERKIIYLSKRKYYKYSGKKMEDKDIESLKMLGFDPVEDGEGIKVSVPAFRSFDIKRDVDIIEEIMRGRGYEFYTSEPLYVLSKPNVYKDGYIREIKRVLISQGFTETINIPFESEENCPKIFQDDFLKLLNPLNVSENVLRNTLLPSLLRVASFNMKNYNRDIAIFEIAHVFGKRERKHLGLLAMGTRTPYPAEKWEFHHLSSIMNCLSELAGAEIEVRSGKIPFLQEGAGGFIYKENKFIGFIGKISAYLADRYELKESPIYMEVDVDTLFSERKQKLYSPLSKYPPVIRDLSLLMDKNISVYKLLSEIKSLLGRIVEEVKVFDVYTGSAVGEGKKSVGLRLYLRSYEGSLTSEEVNELVAKVVRDLDERYGVKIR